MTDKVIILAGVRTGQIAYVTNEFPEQGLVNMTPVDGDPLDCFQYTESQVQYLDRDPD